MMKTFRDNMKAIFFILILFFVGWMAFTLTGLDKFFVEQHQIDTRGAKYAGLVNGKPIDRSLYQNQVQSTVDMITRQREGGSLSPWEIDQIAEQVWTKMLNERMMERTYREHGIKISNEEVVEYIKGNPPSELFSEPSFQTDGRFDYNKYLALLANPQARQLVLELEREARENIPALKLFPEIASLPKITDSQVRMAYDAGENKVKVSYIHFPTDSLIADSAVSVTDKEVEKYHQDNIRKFERPDMVALSYIVFPLVPSGADTLAAEDTIKMILGKLEQGVEWDTLAARYSRDPSASSGGDLGWFARGDFTDKKLEQAAFSLRPGQVSRPYLSDDGWSIVRLDSVRTKDGKREVKARRIISRIEVGREEIRAVNARARNLRRLVRTDERKFPEAVADSGFEAISTGLFAVGNRTPGLETTRELLDFTYSAQVGTTSYPMETATTQGKEVSQGLVLVHVDDRKEKGTIPLKEISEEIRRTLILEKKKALAQAQVEKILEGYRSYASLGEFAKAKSLAIQTSPEFTRAEGLPEVGRYNAFVGTAFGLPVGARSELISVGHDFYLLEVLSKTGEDDQKFEQSRKQVVQQLQSQIMQNAYSLFTQELYEKTKIEDLRRPAQPDTVEQKEAGVSASRMR